jgi:Patatin phospholipase/Patatin-like phospholipase
VYFDNHKMQLGPGHVMASGALPPGFPPVEIDGELYWDGGIVSNSPLCNPIPTSSGSVRSARGAVALMHFINRHNTQSSDLKDYEFSRAAVTDLRNGGLNDARRAVAGAKWKEAMAIERGIGTYDMTTQ